MPRPAADTRPRPHEQSRGKETRRAHHGATCSGLDQGGVSATEENWPWPWHREERRARWAEPGSVPHRPTAARSRTAGVPARAAEQMHSELRRERRSRWGGPWSPQGPREGTRCPPQSSRQTSATMAESRRTTGVRRDPLVHTTSWSTWPPSILATVRPLGLRVPTRGGTSRARGSQHPQQTRLPGLRPTRPHSPLHHFSLGAHIHFN